MITQNSIKNDEWQSKKKQNLDLSNWKTKKEIDNTQSSPLHSEQSLNLFRECIRIIDPLFFLIFLRPHFSFFALGVVAFTFKAGLNQTQKSRTSTFSWIKGPWMLDQRSRSQSWKKTY